MYGIEYNTYDTCSYTHIYLWSPVPDYSEYSSYKKKNKICSLKKFTKNKSYTYKKENECEF